MIFPHPNKVIRSFYPDALWRVKTDNKELYLTFDDGPTPGVTERILDLLTQFNALATFFCQGSEAEKHSLLAERIQKSGHGIGNHSYSHPNGRKTKNEDYFKDVERGFDIVKSNLFRPPYGSLKKIQYTYLKQRYKIVFWDVLTYDFHPKIDSERCFQIVNKYSHPGSVIVFHDNKKASGTMLTALKKTLEYYSGAGYRFEKLFKVSP